MGCKSSKICLILLNYIWNLELNLEKSDVLSWCKKCNSYSPSRKWSEQTRLLSKFASVVIPSLLIAAIQASRRCFANTLVSSSPLAGTLGILWKPLLFFAPFTCLLVQPTIIHDVGISDDQKMYINSAIRLFFKDFFTVYFLSFMSITSSTPKHNVARRIIFWGPSTCEPAKCIRSAPMS